MRYCVGIGVCVLNMVSVRVHEGVCGYVLI